MKKFFNVILVFVLVMSLSTIASAKDDFADKQSGTYFTGNYYLIGSEEIISICSELSLKKGTIIRSDNVAFKNYLYDGGTNGIPEYYTLRYSPDFSKNNQIVVLDEDMDIYLTNGGYICTSFNNIDDYLSTLKSRCNIDPAVNSRNPQGNSVFYMDETISLYLQIENLDSENSKLKQQIATLSK